MADPLTQRDRHRKRPDAATIDHVLPRTLGGMTSWLNEVAACRACNATKADRMPRTVELWRLIWLKREMLLALTGREALLTALAGGIAPPRPDQWLQQVPGTRATGS